MFDGLATTLGPLFAHPWAAAAGVALVGVPLLIHLINRLRYKRVRWAAMEFLLKAQKRVRRKMIVQQLVLLLLRCLLVALLGVLVARFFGLDILEPEARATAHVVVLDDSPSMADGVRRDDGTASTAFEEAKTVLVNQVMKAAAEATTRQRVEVYRLSDLANPAVIDRLGEQAIRDYAEAAKATTVATVRVPLVDGLKRARQVLADQPADVAKVVHVLSDFRASDWADGADPIKDVCGQLTAAGVKVNLIDVAHPYRDKASPKLPLAHDNLAITEFTPARLVAARYDPVEFTLRVRNFGAAEVKGVRFAVKVNGDENKGRSVAIDTLPGNQERTVKVEIPFDRVGTDARPLDRFSLVTAVLATPEPGGLAADNVRHAVVEVRDRLPILVIDGKPALRDTLKGDGTYLRPVFTAVVGGYSWQYGGVKDLEAPDLVRYAFVLLLNVPTLPESAVKSLEAYARNGGGVGFFLGPDVRAADYNKALYRDGAGLFPVPLADQPSRVIPDDELQARRLRISQKKLLMRDPARRAHPALAGLYTDERGEPVADADKLERVFGFISVKQYWPVQKVGKWRDDPALAELYALPNDQAMADYEAPVRAVADGLRAAALQADKFRDVLAAARNELQKTVSTSEPLYRLAAVLDDLLADQSGTGDAAEALLRVFWADPQRADLRAQTARLRDAVKFGDPFYLAKGFGRGRVTVVTTTAGEAWSDWPSEQPGSASFAPVMKEMGAYLSAGGAGENHLVGSEYEARFDPARYKPSARKAFVTHDPDEKGARDLAPLTDQGEVPLAAEADRLVLRVADTARPGAYLFTLTPVNAAGGPAQEYRAAAFNIDAAREGDLRRAGRDDVTLTAAGARLHSAGDPEWVKELRNKTTDLSESWYLVLVLGGLLLAEQFMATRLSFTTPV